MSNELSTSFNDISEEDYNINFTSTSRTSNDKHKLNSSLCDSILVTLIKSSEKIGQNIIRNAICPVPTVVNDYEHDHVTKLISLYGGMDEKLWTDLQCALQMIKESRDKRTFKSSKLKTDESELEDLNTRQSSSLPLDLYGDCREEDRRISENKSRCSVLQLVVDNWAVLNREVNTSSERSVCKRASVVQNDSVSLTLYTDVEMVATAERTEKCSTLADLLTGSERTAQSSTPEYYSANLGKRGRYYLDVWEEQQYLASAQSSSSLMLLGLMTVENWSQLLHSYRDAHDGAYRDWMLAALTEEHAELLATQSSGGKKKSRKIDPIFSRPGVQGLTEQSKALLSRIRPPPVPTSVQHPASWAICRLETEDMLPSSDEKCASFDRVHPASVRSAAVVHPPLSLQNRHGGAACSPDRVAKKRRLGMNRASGADDWVEDVDDFSVLAEHLSRQLDSIEAANFSRLQRIKHLATIDGQLKAMRVRRLALEDVVYRALRKNEPKTSERVIYTSLRSRRGAEMILQPYLGACLANHVPFGSILESMLHVNSFVEARLQQQWRICRVLGLQKDGELLRHVKVCPVNGLPSSSMWIAVEDGQLAPRGTHTHWAGGTGAVDSATSTHLHSVDVSGGDSSGSVGCYQVATSATECSAALEHKECPDLVADESGAAVLNQQGHKPWSPHKFTLETQNDGCCDDDALHAIRLAAARDGYPQLTDLPVPVTGFCSLSPAILPLPSYSRVFEDEGAFHSSFAGIYSNSGTGGVNQAATTFRISSSGHLTKNE